MTWDLLRNNKERRMNEKDVRREIKEFLRSKRYKGIKRMRKLAKKYDLCQEKIDGKCMYPHCTCLYDLIGEEK